MLTAELTAIPAAEDGFRRAQTDGKNRPHEARGRREAVPRQAEEGEERLTKV